MNTYTPLNAFIRDQLLQDGKKLLIDYYSMMFENYTSAQVRSESQEIDLK